MKEIDKAILEIEKQRGDINKQDANGNTLLMLAIANKQFAKAKYLIDLGADLDKKNKLKYTALTNAIINGYLSIAEYLIAKGAKLDIKTGNENNTALIIASTRDKSFTEIALQLINRGAKLNIKNKEGNAPLSFAVRNNNFTLVEYLVEKGADINTVNDQGTTALMVASYNNDIELVEYLVEKGAKLDIKNKYGHTALLGAVMNTQNEIAMYLINHGTKLDTQYNDGNTLLIYATNSENFELVKYLVDKGAKLDIRNGDGYTALIVAINAENAKMVDYLFKHGASISKEQLDKRMKDSIINLYNNINRGAILGYSNWKDDQDIIIILLDHGADINTISMTNLLLEYVKSTISARFLPFIRSLINRGAIIPQDLIITLKKNYPDKMRAIISELIRKPIRRKRIERLAAVATELYYRPNLEYNYFEGDLSGGAAKRIH